MDLQPTNKDNTPPNVYTFQFLQFLQNPTLLGFAKNIFLQNPTLLGFAKIAKKIKV
jgi:hypothetical protein